MAKINNRILLITVIGITLSTLIASCIGLAIADINTFRIFPSLGAFIGSIYSTIFFPLYLLRLDRKLAIYLITKIYLIALCTLVFILFLTTQDFNSITILHRNSILVSITLALNCGSLYWLIIRLLLEDIRPFISLYINYFIPKRNNTLNKSKFVPKS